MIAPIVMKFGGSSVADVHKLQAIAAWLLARQKSGESLVVVVSAMGKTTDGLIAQAQEISANPCRRELDMLVTAGERISMALLSMAIESLGGQAISFTGSQSGIITEDAHQGARIVTVRPARIEEALALGRIVIVAGYQGVSATTREVTTLGRGGSDTTAVALAAALGASACEIYSDVDGVYSADPNVCPQATLLAELDYETMQTMAGVGAKVLNAEAVGFARQAKITIAARKTGDASGRQTVVSDVPSEQHSGVVAVVGAKKLTELKGSSGRMAEIQQGVRAVGAQVVAMHLQLGQCSLLVGRSNMAAASGQAVHEIATAHNFEARDCQSVSLVGWALCTQGVIASAAWQHLLDAGSAPQSLYGNDQALTFTVEDADFGVRLLHARFVG